MNGLTKNDSGLIGFVLSALQCHAINIEELHEWVCFIYEHGSLSNKLPSYLIDLLDFNDHPSKAVKLTGFWPPWPYSDDQGIALLGITAKRGRDPGEWVVPKTQALQMLDDHPEIEARFYEVFQFLKSERTGQPIALTMPSYSKK